MIDIVAFRKGNIYTPFSEEDHQAGLVFPERMALRLQITGTRKLPSYRQLCAYWGSCGYIASLNLDSNKNTKKKVDHLTRLVCGFVEDTVTDGNGLLHWIPKSLSYENCDQKDRQEFITQALERHAELAGINDVEKYVRHLNLL